MDTVASVAQCMSIADAGADIVRLTAQGVREAQNMGVIRGELRRRGYDIPLVADIHFNPRAAFAAAAEVEKVRINPGNFVDPGRVFKHLEYTDGEYAAELQRIREAFVPFLELCRSHGTAIRIGVNHGSLSDRIMSRYGDTPAGMVESAMEYLRVCVSEGFMDVVISIKASNTVVMVETVRRLVKAMDAEGMAFPLHLGVTEAGDGEDGRIKSAAGIGALLSEGIGDTIRVSLSEDPACEVPVAKAIVDHVNYRADAPSVKGDEAPGYCHEAPARRHSVAVGDIGGGNVPVAVGVDLSVEQASRLRTVDASAVPEGISQAEPLVLYSSHRNAPAEILAALHSMIARGIEAPVIVRLGYEGTTFEEVAIAAAVDFGRILMAGMHDGIWIDAPALSADELSRLSLGILQAARCRTSKTEYIACPGCGRTLFDLRSTLRDVKAATSHLKGLKIGVMGCIVNGPGEMADADFGYVGASAGHISLYRGKECIEKNIPQQEAIGRLVELIRDSGQWVDP
jgi:(E)-4-hydroxy-3-methylbut-2-enyl-diphosphate synthase